MDKFKNLKDKFKANSILQDAKYGRANRNQF